MKLPIYSVRDNVSNEFSTNFFIAKNEQEAYRGFAYGVNQPGMMQFEPNDFALYHIGFFDVDKGILEPLSPLVLICTGGDVVEK